eukprot:365069-Chlamydomonas_euryale.AAC.10
MACGCTVRGMACGCTVRGMACGCTVRGTACGCTVRGTAGQSCRPHLRHNGLRPMLGDLCQLLMPGRLARPLREFCPVALVHYVVDDRLEGSRCIHKPRSKVRVRDRSCGVGPTPDVLLGNAQSCC